MNTLNGGNPDLKRMYLKKIQNDIPIMTFENKTIPNSIVKQKIQDDMPITTFENKIEIILNNIIKQNYRHVNKSIMSEFKYYKYNVKNKYQLFNMILINLVKFYIDDDKRNDITSQNNMITIIESIKTNNNVIIFLKQILIEIIKYGDINSIPEEKKYEDYFNFEPYNEWKYRQKCFTKKFIDEKISDNEIEALFELYIISNLLTF